MSLPFDPIAEARRQWRAQGWTGGTAMAAVTSVFRAHQIILARINAVLKPLGLTFARYEVLTLLHVSKRGTLPLSLIGERLQVSPASVTNAVDKLEGSGHVVREAHPTDGRTTLAAITDAGRDLVREATTALEDMRFGAAGIDDIEAEELIRVLGALRVGAGDMTEGRLGRHMVDAEKEAALRARRR